MASLAGVGGPGCRAAWPAELAVLARLAGVGVGGSGYRAGRSAELNGLAGPGWQALVAGLAG